MKANDERQTEKESAANLYWVSTEDHDEDWFILSNSARTAEQFHIEYEGYEPGDAHAELVLTPQPIPDGLELPRHAQIEDLIALGFEVLNPDPNGRTVKLGNRVFVEGHLEALVNEANDDVMEARGRGRPQGTRRMKKAN